MNPLAKIFGALVAAFLGVMIATGVASHAAAAPLNKQMVVGLPADYSGSIEDVQKQINIIELSMRPGQRVTVVNALTGDRIADVTLPDEERYLNQNVRLRALALPFAKVHQWIKEQWGANTASQGVPSRIATTYFLQEIGEHLLVEADSHEVLLLGSPRAHDDRVPQYSMRDDAWPSDAMITAREDQSLYGTAGRPGLLKGVSLHFCITDKRADWKSPQAAPHIQRFWSLYVKALAGRVSTYTPDLPNCVERFLQGNLEPVLKPELDSTDKSFGMVSIVPAKVTEETKPVPGAAEPVKAAPVVPAVQPQNDTPQPAPEKPAEATAAVAVPPAAAPEVPLYAPSASDATQTTKAAPAPSLAQETPKPAITEGEAPKLAGAQPCVPAVQPEPEKKPVQHKKPRRNVESYGDGDWMPWRSGRDFYASYGDDESAPNSWVSSLFQERGYSIRPRARSTVTPSITRRAKDAALGELAGDKSGAERCQ